MKTYTVKDIAELLDTSTETVRRWISYGKLQAEQESRKEGNLVTKERLEEFLKNTPKYEKKIAALSGAVAVGMLNPALGMLISTTLGMVSLKQMNQKKQELQLMWDICDQQDSNLNSDEVKNAILNYIHNSETVIQRKENYIKQVQEEIRVEQKHIELAKKILGQLAEEDKKV